MIPVYQDKFLVGKDVPPEQLGNCLQACVASLMELPLEDVPHFVSYGKGWFSKLVEFTKARGYSYDSVRDGNGLEGYYLVAGKSPRGDWLHCVIYLDGVMIHDPHPSGDGILTEEFFETLTPPT